MKRINAVLIVLGLALYVSSCSPSSEKKETKREKQEVNVYTHRHYDVDQRLFKEFTEKTGIKVNVVSASADELIKKLEIEGENSPADVLITVDAGRLYRAKSMDLLQAVSSEVLDKNIPTRFKDQEGFWYGLTYRARIIAINKSNESLGGLANYEDLVQPGYAGKILIRSSENIYNQSLLASIIAHNGSDVATDWASGMVKNMARNPKGNDRDQVKAIAAGLGEIAVVNTYYIGHLLNSENEEERRAAESVKIIFPNQDGRGTHINVSGAGVTRYAPNKAQAIKFIEFLSKKSAQEVFAGSNYEYPVNQDVPWSEILEKWGRFKTDTINFNQLGINNREAVMIFDAVNWK